MTTLGELAQSGVLEFGDGYRTKRFEHAASGFRILRAGDVRDGRVHPNGPDSVSLAYAGAIGNKSARLGDVVLTTKGTVGKTGIVGELTEPVVYSPQVCYFRCQQPEELDAGFLHQWLRSPRFIDQSGYLKDATDMAPYISLRDLASIQIELPKPPTQRAIAEVLGAVDDKIAVNSQVAHATEALLAAQFARLQADPDAQEVTAADLVELNPRCPTPSKGQPVYVDMQKLPTRGSQIMDWGSRTAQGGARFVNGDTLVARITPCLENRKVGFVDFLEPGETAIGSTEFIVLRAKPGFAKPLSFLLAVDEGFRSHAIQHMIGSSGRQRVGAADLATFQLRLPVQSAEFASFGGKAEALFALLAAQRNESRHLATLRDTLLPHLMSGRLTVRDAEARVEAAL